MRASKQPILYLILILFLSLFGTSIPSKSPTKILPTPTVVNSPIFAQVTRVIDGDTIEIDNGQRVRYIGIDTPELHKPNTPVQCFAERAKEENEKLVLGKKIRLAKDISETDRYGRLLRYVYLEKEATTTPVFVNDYLVREGFAYAVTFPPDVKYQELFLSNQREARDENKGLWGRCK